MQITELKPRPEIGGNSKVNNPYEQFKNIIIELNKKEIPASTIEKMNVEIQLMNSFRGTDDELKKLIRNKQNQVLKIAEKDTKIVVKNHHRNIWLPVGMTVFGLPIGVAFGMAIDNMAMMATFLPIGMFVGIIVGSLLDQKAQKEGRQLDLNLKY